MNIIFTVTFIMTFIQTVKFKFGKVWFDKTFFEEMVRHDVYFAIFCEFKDFALLLKNLYVNRYLNHTLISILNKLAIRRLYQSIFGEVMAYEFFNHR